MVSEGIFSEWTEKEILEGVLLVVGIMMIFKKPSKKNKKQLLIIFKKLNEIRENPHHAFKHLRKPLEDFYRVHIDSSFVIIFAIDHADQEVTVYYYGHHDSVYKWRPKIG